MVKVVDQVTDPKRKRFNKNKKKAWRKKANITEVEERLEDQRREERYGGPLEERKDSEMMFVDLGGETEASQENQENTECFLEFTVDEIPETEGKIKLKPRKVKLKTPKLKSHQFLNGLPGAKPPHKQRKNKGTLTVAMKKKKELQSKDPKQIKKRKEAMKQMLGDIQKTTKRPKSVINSKYTTDLWEVGGDAVTQECKKKGLEESFIGSISDYYRRERRMKPVKVPKIRHVPTSKLDPVSIPHAGASYNPSQQSHQKLLLRAVKQEEKHLKKVGKIERATTKMFPTIDKAPTKESWLTEMSEGLPKAYEEEEEPEESVEECEEQENEETVAPQQNGEQGKQQATSSKAVVVSNDNVTVSSKPITERKTKKIRRKEKKQKLQKLKKIKEKEDRIRSSNIYKLKTYQKEIVKEELQEQKRSASRRAHKEHLKFIPRRLGNMKFEEEEIPVNLGDELADSLRTVVPAVELLEDRFKNLQRRNLLEPRLKHKLKRKYKPKVVLKRAHREELAKIEKMEFSD
ncbi:ribosome biogenesis protein NOP53-like isoform X2 [Portunus trituberculatus]|nr:ribosome biogenesis protein NOP53-like isoform X2 [Portunus trituberculatus]